MKVLGHGTASLWEGGKAWYLLLDVVDPEGDTSPHIAILESVQTVFVRSSHFK